MPQSADDFLGDHPSADDFLGGEQKPKALSGPKGEDNGSWLQAAEAVADTAKTVAGNIIPGAIKGVAKAGAYLAAPLAGEGTHPGDNPFTPGETTKSWDKAIDDFVDSYTPDWLAKPSTAAGQQNVELASKAMGAVGDQVRKVPGIGEGAAEVGGDIMNASPLLGVPGLARGAYGAADSAFGAANKILRGGEEAAPAAPSTPTSRAFGTSPPVGQPDALGHPVDGGLPENTHEARSSLLSRVVQNEDGTPVQQRQSAAQGNKKMAADDYQLGKLPEGDPTGDRFRQQFQDEKNGLIRHATQTVNAAEGADVGVRGTDEDVRVERANNIQAAHDAIDNAAQANSARLYQEAAANAAATGARLQAFPELQNVIGTPAARNIAAARGWQGTLDGMAGEVQRMMGDNGGSLDPNQAEQLRQSFNQMRTPANARVVDEATRALTQDVTNATGKDFYADARANHAMRMQTTGSPEMQDLFGRDANGNWRTPRAQLADSVTKLPAEQLNKLMSVWRSAAATGDETLAGAARQGINEVQGHAANQVLGKTVSTAAQNARDLWNGSSVTQHLNNNAARLREIFADKPQVLQRFQDLDDAGKILNAPQAYPGASAQAALNAVRGGIGARIAKYAGGAGAAVGSLVAGPYGAIAGERFGSLAGDRIAAGAAARGANRSFRAGAPATEVEVPPAGNQAPWMPRPPRAEAAPRGGAQAAMDELTGRNRAASELGKGLEGADASTVREYAAADRGVQSHLQKGDTTAGGLLSALAEHTQDETGVGEIRKNLQRGVDKNGDVTIKTHDGPFMANGEEAVGHYDPDSNTIHLAKDADTQTAYHELVHAYTSRFIDANPNAAATKELSRLYNAVKKVKGVDPNLAALKDEHEFLAEAVSNPSFQRLLGKIKDPSAPGKMWNTIVETVSKALGMAHTKATQSALNHALKLHDVISNAPQKALRTDASPVSGHTTARMTLNHAPDSDRYTGSHLSDDTMDSILRGNYIKSKLADGTPIRIVHARQPGHSHLDSLVTMFKDQDIPKSEQPMLRNHIEMFGGRGSGDYVLGRLFYASKDVDGKVGGPGLRHNPNITANKRYTDDAIKPVKGIASRLYQEAEANGGLIPYSSEPGQDFERTEEGKAFRNQSEPGRMIGLRGQGAGGTKIRTEKVNEPVSREELMEHMLKEGGYSSHVVAAARNNGMSPEAAEDFYKEYQSRRPAKVESPPARGQRRQAEPTEADDTAHISDKDEAISHILSNIGSISTTTISRLARRYQMKREIVDGLMRLRADM